MTFYDFPIYDIPESDQIRVIRSSRKVIVLVQDNQYGESEKVLLNKIISAAKVPDDEQDIVVVKEGQIIRFDENSKDQLIIIFGKASDRCHWQLDSIPYRLLRRKHAAILFSNSLDDLPKDPGQRRALWECLKTYFNID